MQQEYDAKLAKTKAKEEKEKEEAEKKKEEEEKKHQEEILKLWERSQTQKIFIEAEEREAEEQRRQAEIEQQLLDSEMEIMALEEAEDAKRRAAQETADYKRRLRERELEETLANAEATNTQLAGLTNALFDFQLNLAEGNEKKEMEIRKRQFNANKAFGIADATINGIRAVQAALASPAGPPLSIILASLAGATAAANIAKIASQKFEGGGSGGGAVTGGGSIGGTIEAPRLTAPTQGSSLIDENGQVIQDDKAPAPTVKALVVETDITNTQNNVAQVQDKATL